MVLNLASYCLVFITSLYIQVLINYYKTYTKTYKPEILCEQYFKMEPQSFTH